MFAFSILIGGLILFLAAVSYIVWDVKRNSNVQILGKSLENPPTKTPPSQATPKNWTNPFSKIFGLLWGMVKLVLVLWLMWIISVRIVIPFVGGFIRGTLESFNVPEIVRTPDRKAELTFNKDLPPYGVSTNAQGNVITAVGPADAHIVVEQDGQGGIRQVCLEDGRIATNLTDQQRCWFTNAFQKVESIRQLESIVMLHTDRKEQSLVILLSHKKSSSGQWKAIKGELLRQFYYTDQNTQRSGLNPAGKIGGINGPLDVWDKHQRLMKVSMSKEYITDPFGIAKKDHSGVQTFLTGNPTLDVENLFGSPQIKHDKGLVSFGLPIEWEDWVKRSQSYGKKPGEAFDGKIGFEIILANQ
jgi:hypothetical protein